MSNGPQIVVIQGLGGQGKTQIALEFCRSQKSGEIRGIFWVFAQSESTVKDSFKKIAHEIKTADEHVPEDATDFVLRKLGLWDGSWLLVFDNYDDIDDFKNIQDFMPDHDEGYILITSRSSSAERLANDRCAITLLGLPEADALKLLQNTALPVPIDNHSDQVLRF